MLHSAIRRLATSLVATGVLSLLLFAAPDVVAQTVAQTGAPIPVPVPVFDAANTAWVLTATALVLFMTLPGLALFYGGLVRAQNVLSVLMQCFAICCLVSVLWLLVGYSLAFGNGGGLNPWIGGFDKVLLVGVGTQTLSGSLPEVVFFMFQMTFAIITPALIVGAYVERIKFGAVMLFSGLWLLAVYAPVAHWVWGGGWLAAMGVQDFAGGLVVHVTAGTSALVLAAMLGTRRGFPREMHPPHSPGLVMMGAAMLWVGWYGFNGGSALTSDGAAGMAILVTHISAATAAITWMAIEWIKHGRPTLIGTTTGAIAGLATITPASGFIGPVGALAYGVIAGLLCYGCVGVVKQRLKIDDALDVLAVHGIGGAAGTLLCALFGAATYGGLGLSKLTIGDQLMVQATGMVATALWSGLATYVIVLIVKALVGLRVSEEHEIEGLDLRAHGEQGYLF